MDNLTLFCAVVGILAVIAVPSLIEVHRLSKRARKLSQYGHDRAARREFDWYWESAPETKKAVRGDSRIP